MKSLILLAIYIASFIAIFLITSFPGWLFIGSYKAVIYCTAWQVMYSFFVGWWMAILPAREYYLLHEKYFDKLF
jgi:hypothetical protein